MALMFASIDYRHDPLVGDQIRYRPMFYTGVGLFVGSIITGAVLAAQDDEAHVNRVSRRVNDNSDRCGAVAVASVTSPDSQTDLHQ
jgi:hypothetical protein